MNEARGSAVTEEIVRSLESKLEELAKVFAEVQGLVAGLSAGMEQAADSAEASVADLGLSATTATDAPASADIWSRDYIAPAPAYEAPQASNVSKEVTPVETDDAPAPWQQPTETATPEWQTSPGAWTRDLQHSEWQPMQPAAEDTEPATPAMSTPSDAEPLSSEPTAEDEAAVREQVRLAVEQARAELEAPAETTRYEAWAPAPPASEPSSMMMRDDSWGFPKKDEAPADAWPTPAAPEPTQESEYSPPAANEPVWSPPPSAEVQPVWAELTPEPEASVEPEVRDQPEATFAEPVAFDAEAAREEVRRAVEQARADMAGGGWPMDAAASGPSQSEETTDELDADLARMVEQLQKETAHLSPDNVDNEYYQPSRFKMPEAESVPTMIVLDDPDGRIELVKVYDTLDRLQCSDSATLLNYSPRNVAIGLGLAPLPDADSLVSAVSAAFGRSCEVRTEGERLAVRIRSAAA